MVALDTYTIVTGEFFKIMLSLESFSNTEGDLMAMIYVCRCMIHKSSATIVLGGLFLFTFGIPDATRESQNILINRDTFTWKTLRSQIMTILELLGLLEAIGLSCVLATLA
jgi:hypothetical protein